MNFVKTCKIYKPKYLHVKLLHFFKRFMENGCTLFLYFKATFGTISDAEGDSTFAKKRLLIAHLLEIRCRICNACVDMCVAVAAAIYSTRLRVNSETRFWH